MEKDFSAGFEAYSQQLLRITNVSDFDRLDDLRYVGDSKEIDMGEIHPVNPDQFTTIFSYGANPCISGIIFDKNSQLYCFHSSGAFLTPEQETVINSTLKGFVGGSQETLAKYRRFLVQNHIKIAPPPSPFHDFNYVLVKAKNEFKAKLGFYFCYDDQIDLG